LNKPGLRSRGYRRCKQGYYVCKHPEKYIGNSDDIIYRSGIELSYFRYLDENKNVKKWGSEIVKIPYFDESTNKSRNYIVDVYFEYISKLGVYEKAIVEIKNYKQTLPPEPSKRSYYTNRAMLEYKKNLSKWKYAKQYADKNNLKFFILTEKDIT